METLGLASLQNFEKLRTLENFDVCKWRWKAGLIWLHHRADFVGHSYANLGHSVSKLLRQGSVLDVKNYFGR